MANLGNPKKTIELIQKYSFRFQKKYGQNFLIDSHVIEKIISSAHLTKEDCILEIGPGIGTMTQALAEQAGKVIAVEIDKNLIPILSETLENYSNITILNQDILKLDLKKLSEEENNGNSFQVIANLPYYITTPIIMEILEGGAPVDNITVMVQKEVANRMQAEPGSKEYGALSLAVQYYAKPKIVANVPPNCFLPRPKVGSAVIQLIRYNTLPVKATDEKMMFALIRAAFNQRRKTLVNALSHSPALSFTKEQVQAALRKEGLSLDVRGEALSLSQFAKLSDFLVI